jgi:hypothetical protein
MRIAFDDDNTREIIDDPAATTAATTAIAIAILKAPQESEHWQSLVHEESDNLIHTLEDLKDRFRSDVLAHTTCTKNKDVSSNNNNNNNGGEPIAFWSCLVGYCEALATHKEASRRYKIFPIPIDALDRLVTTEFWSRVLVPAEAAAAAAADTSRSSNSSSLPASDDKARHEHRSRVQAVANAIWDTAGNSQKKDEEHANSLYVCLRGHIDRKSIDCLGSSVATVAGVKLLQQQVGKAKHENESENENGPSKTVVTSMLTLSEGKKSVETQRDAMQWTKDLLDCFRL